MNEWLRLAYMPALLLVTLVLPRLSSAQATDLFDVTWYDLELNVDRSRAAQQQEIQGRVVIHGQAPADRDSIRLDLASHMNVGSVRDVDQGGLLTFRHENDVLWIHRSTNRYAQIRIEISWPGTPIPTGFESWSSGTLLGEPYYWTLSEPYGARSWWPVDDHPSDRADSVRVRVRLPVPTRVNLGHLSPGVYVLRVGSRMRPFTVVR